MKLYDKVAIKSTPFKNPLLQPGETGIVVGLVDCDINPTVFQVSMDSGHEPEAGLGWCFYEYELELANE